MASSGACPGGGTTRRSSRKAPPTPWRSMRSTATRSRPTKWRSSAPYGEPVSTVNEPRPLAPVDPTVRTRVPVLAGGGVLVAVAGDDQRDVALGSLAQQGVVDGEHVGPEGVDPGGDVGCRGPLDRRRLVGAGLVGGGEGRVGHPQDADTGDLGDRAVEELDVVDRGQGLAVSRGVVVAGDQQVRHLHRADQVAEAALDREPERRQITGVEDGLHLEVLGQAPRDLQPQRVGVDVADVQDPHLVPGHRPADPGTGHGVQLGHLVAQHLHPLADDRDVVDVPADGGQQRRRPLERPFEAGVLESVGVVAVPGPAEQEGHGHHRTGRTGQGMGPAPAGDERPGQGAGHHRGGQRPPGERPEQRLEVGRHLRLQPVAGGVGGQEGLEPLDADFVDLGRQPDRRGVGGGRDLSQGREAEFRPAGAEVGPDGHPARADRALRHGDRAQRQEPGGRAEEDHEQIGESPAHDPMVPAGGAAQDAALRPLASPDRG